MAARVSGAAGRGLDRRAPGSAIRGALPGAARATPAALVPSYTAKLRKSQPAWCLPACSEQHRHDRASHLRRVLQGRHRPGHQVGLAGARSLAHRRARPGPRPAEHRHRRQLAAGGAHRLALHGGRVRRGAPLRLADDLSRHRRRQARAGDAHLQQARGRARPRPRPGASAGLVVGVGRGNRRGHLAAGADRDRGLLRRASAGGGLPRVLQDGDAQLAAHRHALPHHHGPAQPEPDPPERGNRRRAAPISA